MRDKFKDLVEIGAGDFEHIDGSLIEHLNGTRDLLKQWGASRVLQDAGLFHAAYSTAGFSQSFVSTSQRSRIVGIIGQAAEEIVYQYCACDREVFFSRIGRENAPLFQNRFTSESYHLSESTLRCFCELTAANECEIALDNREFVDQHGAGLYSLFSDMTPYLSDSAREKTVEMFGARSS